MADLPIGDLVGEVWERFRASPWDFLVLAFLAAAIPVLVQTAALWPINPQLLEAYRSTGATGSSFGVASSLFSQSFAQVPGADVASGPPVRDTVLGAAISMVVATVLGALFGGALVSRALDDPDDGDPVRSLRTSLDHLPALIVAGFALGVLALVLILPGFGLVLTGTAGRSMGLIGLGLVAGLAGFVIAVYVLVATFVYQAVVVDEDLHGVEALRRSWELTRGRRLHVFLALVIVGIILAVVALIVQAPFLAAQLGTVLAGGPPTSTAVAAGTAGSILAGTVTGAFFPILAVRIYRRLADRDIETETGSTDPVPDEGYVPVD